MTITSKDDGVLSILPDYIVALIFSFVSHDCTYSRFCRVNKRWQRISLQEWKRFCERRDFLKDELFWVERGKDWRWICKSKKVQLSRKRLLELKTLFFLHRMNWNPSTKTGLDGEKEETPDTGDTKVIGRRASWKATDTKETIKLEESTKVNVSNQPLWFFCSSFKVRERQLSWGVWSIYWSGG